MSASPATQIGAIARGYRKKRALEKRVAELRKALKSGEPCLLQSLQAIPSHAIAVGGVNIRIKTSKTRRRPKAQEVLPALQSLIEERDAAMASDSLDAVDAAEFAKSLYELCTKAREETERECIAVDVEDGGAVSDSSEEDAFD